MRQANLPGKTLFSFRPYETTTKTQFETQAGKQNRRLRHAPSCAAY